MRIRRAVAATGRVLIATGILLLLFVAYQLWGTGIATAREQRSLKADLERQLGFDPNEVLADLSDPGATGAGDDPVVADTTVPGGSDTARAVSGPATPATGAPPTTRRATPTTFRSKRPPVPVKEGEAVGYIKIPRIDVGWAFVSGTTTDALKKGPGHYEKTPLPGQPGNAAIAGHRTTYGAPFYRLDELRAGDPIFVVTRQGRFRYEVTGTRVVSPKAVDVLNPVPGRNLLTLTTCHPRFSAAKRLVVVADLVGEAAEADVVPVTTTVPPTTLPPTTLPPTTAPPTTAAGTGSSSVAAPDTTVAAATTVPDTVPGGAGDGGDDGTGSLREAEQRGSWRIGWLAGEPGVWGDALVWAVVCTAIWTAAWVVARGRRRVLTWLGVYAAFTVPFLVALYFCYENLARLLPADV